MSKEMENMEAILSLNGLAVLLHRSLIAKGGNVFASPVSMSAVLAMLQQGAVGKAAQELRDSMGSDGSGLARLLCSPPRDCTLANALVAQNFVIKKEFQDDLEINFGTQVMLADFYMETDQAVSEINNWVKEKTNGAVSHLLDSIDKQTILILLNAVYFKGTWMHKFNMQKTIQQNFYCKGSKDNPKLINMMHIKEKFSFAETETFKALKLPYQGGEVAMVIFLPHSMNGLQALEDQLTSSFIEDLQEIWRIRQVEVALPKFHVEFSADLKGPLQDMGIQNIFESNAELSGISDCGQIRVSQVIQKAVLVVDEEGCEAAAATGVIFMLKKSKSITKYFVVDQPFFFVICDTRNNLVLFMGRVEVL